MRVRDDDVLLVGKGFNVEQAMEHFRQVHALIVDGGATHVAAVLCGSIHHFPGLASYLSAQYLNGTLIPEIHGWEHIDYAELPQAEIEEHLRNCIKVIKDATTYNPTKFFTPWGSNASHIDAAARNVGLEMVDTSRVLYPKRKIFTGKMKEEYSRSVIEERQDLFIHWWEDRWFTTETHSLVDTLAIIREVAGRF